MLANDVIGGRGIGKKYENSEKRKKRENRMNKLKNELKRINNVLEDIRKEKQMTYSIMREIENKKQKNKERGKL